MKLPEYDVDIVITDPNDPSKSAKMSIRTPRDFFVSKISEAAELALLIYEEGRGDDDSTRKDSSSDDAQEFGQAT